MVTASFPRSTNLSNFVTEIAEIPCLPVLTNLETNRFTKEIKSRNPKTKLGNRKDDDAKTLVTGANKELAPKDEKKVVCYCLMIWNRVKIS